MIGTKLMQASGPESQQAGNDDQACRPAGLPACDRMYRVLDLVAAERVRQRSLFADGHITHDCSDPATPDDAVLRVATEEIGEVARGIDRLAALDRRERAMKKDFSFRRACLSSDLKNEWIQLAAVAVARAEAMEP